MAWRRREATCGPALLVATTACAILLAFANSQSPRFALADCSETTTVGIDSSMGNTYVSMFLGNAIGQTFFAPESVIASITAWRPAFWDTNLAEWRIFVFGVDSLGAPDLHKMFQSGPVVMVPYSDGIHDTPFKFVFDPPLVLPAKGEYELVIQGDSCCCYFDVRANSTNAYPDGIIWDHGRVIYPPCHVRNFPNGNPDYDLVFKVEFCAPTVPARIQTWGSVKGIYR